MRILILTYFISVEFQFVSFHFVSFRFVSFLSPSTRSLARPPLRNKVSMNTVPIITNSRSGFPGPRRPHPSIHSSIHSNTCAFSFFKPLPPQKETEKQNQNKTTKKQKQKQNNPQPKKGREKHAFFALTRGSQLNSMKLPIAKEKKEKKEKRKKERKKEKKKERREERKKGRKKERKLKSKQASTLGCAISDCSETASPAFDLIGGGCCWRDGDGDGWKRLDRFRLGLSCHLWLRGWMDEWIVDHDGRPVRWMP